MCLLTFFENGGFNMRGRGWRGGGLQIASTYHRLVRNLSDRNRRTDSLDDWVY